MLLIDATLILNVKAGTNLAEMKVTGYKTVQTQHGSKQEPIAAYAFVIGGNFNKPNVPAPIDLVAGDEIQINAKNGAVMLVERGGKRIWTNEQAFGDAESEVDEKRAALKDKRGSG